MACTEACAPLLPCLIWETAAREVHHGCVCKCVSVFSSNRGSIIVKHFMYVFRPPQSLRVCSFSFSCIESKPHHQTQKRKRNVKLFFRKKKESKALLQFLRLASYFPIPSNRTATASNAHTKWLSTEQWQRRSSMGDEIKVPLSFQVPFFFRPAN